MAYSGAPVKPAAEISLRPGWQFSLGGLFRAVTLSCLAMFMAGQFGPLAAARDIGIVLAIGLAIAAWEARSRKLWIAAGSMAASGFVPTILAAGAPFSERSGVCRECGMSREIREVCGWTTKDEISATEASRWAAPLVPTGHRHAWSYGSGYHRTHWFEPAVMACGGMPEGAIMAWLLARSGDQAAGEQALREYQDIVAGKSTKSMTQYCKEAEDVLRAAALAKLP